MDGRKQTLGTLIADTINKQGLSIRKAAIITGISSSHLAKIIKGETAIPTSVTLVKLANKLDIPAIFDIVGIEAIGTPEEIKNDKQQIDVQYNIVQGKDITTISVEIPTPVAEKFLLRFVKIIREII